MLRPSVFPFLLPHRRGLLIHHQIRFISTKSLTIYLRNYSIKFRRDEIAQSGSLIQVLGALPLPCWKPIIEYLCTWDAIRNIYREEIAHRAEFELADSPSGL